MSTRSMKTPVRTKGRVSRVVPGRLFYVEASDADRTFAVKLNTLRIREPDGSFRRYRGEPFKTLGLRVGTSVVIDSSEDETTVVLEAPGSTSRRRLSLLF